MTFSMRCTLSLLCSIALALTACGSSDKGAGTGGAGKPAGSQGQATGGTKTGSGKTNLSAHQGTILQMSTEMVNLMDNVSQKNIMSPIKVSDVRNALDERVDWLSDMTADDVAKLRKATADVDALIAEIRAHENAQGDTALEARLKKIEDWNRSIKDGLPK